MGGHFNQLSSDISVPEVGFGLNFLSGNVVLRVFPEEFSLKMLNFEVQ